MAFVLTCANYDPEVTPMLCNRVIVEAELLPSTSLEVIELLTGSGFNQEAASLGLMGIMSMWAIGVGFGIMIAMIRKAKAI